MGNKDKNVFIVSTIKIFEGNSAGSARLMNISKALANEGTTVYLCSSKLNKNVSLAGKKEILKNIYLIGEEKKLQPGRIRKTFDRYLNIFRQLYYVKRIHYIIHTVGGECVIYIYPSIEIAMDISSLLYFKVLTRTKLFCDINELRITSLYNYFISSHIIRRYYDLFKYRFDFFKYKLHERITKYYDGLVVISTSLEEYFAKYNANVIRVPILTDTPNIYESKILSYSNTTSFRIGFTGQISLKKEGFESFYKAISAIKEKGYKVSLNLYGPINSNEKDLLLNKMPLKYKIKEEIFYHGIIEQKYLLNDIRNNDLLVLPRPLHPQTRYGFSTKLSEYLISGVPILVTDVSDNHLFIKDGYNGFLIEPGNEELMAKKIMYIVDNYNMLANIVASNAYKTAQIKFHWSNYGPILDKFME